MEQALIAKKLEELRNASIKHIQRLKKEAISIAVFRGVLFLTALYGLWSIFPSGYILLYSFFFLILFLWMMKLQADRKRKIAFETAFQEVLIRDLENKKHDVSAGLSDDLTQHPLASDLDLFGPFSLHASVHRTYSAASARKLAGSLVHYEQEPAKIREQQEKISELSDRIEGIYRFFAFSSLASFSVKEENGLDTWLATAHFPVQIWLVRGLALLFFGIATAVGMEWIPPQLLLYAFLINLMFVYFRNKKITALQLNLSRVHPSLMQVAEQMTHWQNTLSVGEEKSYWEEPRVALRKLSRIMARLDSRLNPLGAFISNGIFLYDLHTVHELEKWRSQYGSKLFTWLSELAEREVLASKVAWFMRRGGTFPQLSDGPFELQFKGLIHPLMDPGKAVANDFSMTDKGRGIVLTGSNMSGKSTFLRTIGSALILAHNGFPLPCSRFIFTPLQLHSAIRVNDSLEEDASYFYAELKRLAEIVNHAANEPRAFILLDEILRGTNSADKQAGSRTLLEQLIIHKQANAILATHDLSLTELESVYPGQIANYAFESSISEDKLSFDYTLKRGVCKQLNAMFLMKKMGIMS